MNNEKEVSNLLQKDSSKLFTWLSKNPEIVSAAIEQDKALTADEKQALLRELYSHTLVEKETLSLLPVTNHNKMPINDSPPPRKNHSRGQGDLKKATLNLNLTDIHQKTYIPRKAEHLEETASGGSSAGGSSDRSNSSQSDRYGPQTERYSPQNSPKPDKNNSQSSPKRLHRASLSSMSRSFFSSSDSSRTIQVHNNNSGLLPEFKLSKPVYKIPVNNKTVKQYIDAHKDHKGPTIKIPLKDGNILIVTEGDKQVYLVNCKQTIGKGAYATIHPAFNLHTGELISAKIFSLSNKSACFNERDILVLVDEYYREHFKTRRYFGFNVSDDGFVLLKNYEQGINLQDFLYNINPDGDEYNLTFETNVLEYGTNTLYMECIDGNLKYTVIAPDKKLVTDTIKQEEFPYCTFNKDLKIKNLSKFTDKILEITAHRKHTFPKYYLDKKNHSPMLLLEIILLIMIQIDILHDCGIIHRDLNPKNIIIDIVDSKPVISLIDFDSAIPLEKVSGYKLVMNHKPVNKSTLYVEIINNRLKYTVLNLEGLPVTDYISDKDLDCVLNDKTELKDLRRVLYKIIEITAKRGHTHAGNPRCGTPGETTGYTPPVINYKASPYDITYDIWQLAIIIGAILTDKHMPDLIRETHFKIFPSPISFPILSSIMDDVFGKRKEPSSLNPDKDFADNLQNLVYHNIIFPVLSELAHSMVTTKLKRSTLLAEINNLEELKIEWTDYISEMRALFSGATIAHTKLLKMINTIYQNKYSPVIRETLIEPQIYTSMLCDLYGLFKSRLTFSAEYDSADLKQGLK